jgi:hypothetical protein
MSVATELGLDQSSTKLVSASEAARDQEPQATGLRESLLVLGGAATVWSYDLFLKTLLFARRWNY